MTFYRGEQYILYGYDIERKAEGVDSTCPLCGLLIQKSSRVAKIRWGAEPDDDCWTITHPDCAENGKMNIRNATAPTPKKPKLKEFRGREQREHIDYCIEHPGESIVLVYHTNRPKGKHWDHKVKMKEA